MRKPKPRFTAREARQYTMFSRLYDRFYYHRYRDRDTVRDILRAFHQLDPAEAASSHAVRRAMRHIQRWSFSLDESNNQEIGTFLRSCLP
jgi:hypothetical protein